MDGARTTPLDQARTGAVNAVAALPRDLGSPTTISETGVDASGVDALADVCTQGSPRPATREDVHALYTSLL